MHKQCENCKTQFKIDKEDKEFYKKINVPSPTFCPRCRMQRRLAFRNERHLHSRKCDLCERSMISVFPADTDYTVYCNECWWSDRWDVMDFGREYDFGPNAKGFFEQFDEFRKTVPHFALHQDMSSVNCEYTNYGISNKSCYMALCFVCEDVYFSHSALQSKSCVDITKCMSCELCYECTDCDRSYNLHFSLNCRNCSDSYFLEDCMGCKNCFCCCGLRNKEFYFENEKLSEEEYKKRISNVIHTKAGISPEFIGKYENRLHEISIKIPKKYIHGTGSENVTGDYIDNCRDIKMGFDGVAGERCAYCDFFGGGNAYDMYDCSYGGIDSSLCYELNGITNFNNCKFIYYGRGLTDCEYSEYCYSGKKLFGCCGLNRKEYCIFNKQYSEEGYEELVGKIIEKMKTDEEYGEFFPIWLSDFAYNESLAGEYFPLSKEECEARRYRWRDKDEKNIPKTDDEALTCENCGKNYKIIKQESRFYKDKGLPIPEICPECRHRKRFLKRNPRKLWERNCEKCNAEFQTTYAPDSPKIVYCEKCYLESIN